MEIETSSNYAKFEDWHIPPRYILTRLLGYGAYSLVCEAFD